MPSDVETWLKELELSEYSQAFAENRIDSDVLPTLTKDDLKDIGVLAVGDRRKILNAIKAMSERVDEPTGDATSEQDPSREPERTIGAERRQLTVMFCDMVGSTELSGRLDPEDLHDLMRRYQDAVAGVVARFEGHVAKFLGDGVLAYFGWPRAYEDQAERAVRSGLAAVDAVARLKTGDGQALAARVGIATGQVVIGDMVGETATDEDAVVGATPNLAARLQGAASPGQVVIGANTRRLIGEAFDLTDLGSHELKGIGDSVGVWSVVGERAAESRFEAAHPGARSQIIGRAPELELLWRAWEQSRQGVGQVVLISGEPGIGKSRLVDALSAKLGDERYTPITLGCSPYHTNSALYPLIVLLERVLGWEREDSADARLVKLERELQNVSLPLDEVIPLFAALLSLPLPEERFPASRLTPQQQKQQTLDAVVAWLLEEAERRPVLWVWEDLHWADPSTIELLGLVIEQTPTAPILNVLTFRPSFAPPWPQRMHMTPLTLNRLERGEVEALIGQHAGGKALPNEVVEHIVDKTDGVPLYVEELTKAILEADFLREHDGRYQLTGPMSGMSIPVTLQDSLMARLDRLPNIREVAQLGAVLGREFVYEMVEAIASLDETSLQNGLDELVAAELLYQRGRPPRAKYIFKHALVQDAAYQSLLRRTRQYYHRQVAELLENRFPEIIQTQPELIAHHCTEAGLAEQAVNHWLDAGQRSVRQSSHLEAIAHLRRGLSQLITLPDTADRARKELAYQHYLGAAFFVTKGYASPEAGEAYQRARELCRFEGDMTQVVTAQWGAWLFNLVAANHRVAMEAAEEILNLAPNAEDAERWMAANVPIAISLLHMRSPAAARPHFEIVVSSYDPAKHHLLLADRHAFDFGPIAISYFAWTLWLLGYPDQAKEINERVWEMMKTLSHPYTLARGYHWSAIVPMLRREWPLVRERSEAAINAATELGFPLVAAAAQVLYGAAIASEGNTQSGVAQMRGGIETYRSTGARYQISLWGTFLAEALLASGRTEEGLDALATAQELVDEADEHIYEAEIARLKGELLSALSGDHSAEAEDALRWGLDVARKQEAKSLELRAAKSLARLWRDQGKMAEARDLLAPVYNWFTEGFDTADLKEAKALLDELG